MLGDTRELSIKRQCQRASIAKGNGADYECRSESHGKMLISSLASSLLEIGCRNLVL
jgi:hypothetical protein